MSIQVHSDLHSHTRSGWRISRLVSGILLLTTTSVVVADSYQHRMLFTPSESMLKAEAKGRVMIYDGLDRKTVDRAMNEQFDRIDNMMFVRTRELQEDGEYYHVITIHAEYQTSLLACIKSIQSVNQILHGILS